ncbi:ESX secretion-associated protein EspG [Actinophytocola sp.]|uniref:ESX secretion-associated protein EspG n=1 Tax=Actinophytocola sp. TaxID=1872138 RepID=UPI003D6A55BC
MAGKVTLTRLEYDVLWEHLRLGPYRPVIAVASPGATERERAELRAKAWASLAAKNLGDADSVDDWLAHQLTRLARPEWEIDARLQLAEQGPRTFALVSRAGRGVTIAVLADDLTLRVTKWGEEVTAAARLLPAHPAGTGNSISLPVAALDRAAARAGSDRDRFRRALVSDGLGKAEARKITAVLGDAIRLGHFGAARTPADGVRRRASHVVSVYDDPAGRYLFTRKKNWVTLLPGTEQAIARQLGELLTELGRT